MKILYVLEHYYPYIGGAEKLFRQLAESLALEENEVEVITTLFDSNLPKSEVVNGVKITRINCHNRFLFSVVSLPAILKAANHYDLIHTTTYNAALPSWIAAKIKRKTIILTFHEVWGKLWFRLPFASIIQKTLYYSFERLIGALPFDHYIAVSEYTKNSLLEIGKNANQITRIYNGLEYERFTNYQWNPKESMFEFIYFGRLGISKGLELIIEATSLLKQEATRPFVVRLIVPKKPSGVFNALNQLIKRHDIADYIVLEHNLSDHELFSRIQEAHCALIPSYSEGFCFTAAEACAIGVPIIHSGLGALAEVVSGSYLKTEDQSPIALTKAMLKALNDNFDKSLEKTFNMSESVNQTKFLYQQMA